MSITILHSAMVASSRAIMVELGLPPYLNNREIQSIHKDGYGVAVRSKHAETLKDYPAFQGYPYVFYIDSQGNSHELYSPYNWQAIKLWVDQIERSL